MKATMDIQDGWAYYVAVFDNNGRREEIETRSPADEAPPPIYEADERKVFLFKRWIGDMAFYEHAPHHPFPDWDLEPEK